MISGEQAMLLYEGSDLHELMRRAGDEARRRHGDRERTYVVERNINYTNVCGARCSFCAFSVSGGDERAYVLDGDAVAEKVGELVAVGGTQILLQGGLDVGLDMAWYEGMLRGIRERFGGVHIHAFSPPEVVFLAERSGLGVEGVLRRLQEAGLASLPGGGAEILVDRVRGRISPGKCNSEQWLEVMRQAHRLGMCTTATMMFGHVETLGERIEHLERLRALQAESLARREQADEGGYFTAFTCWPFQSGGTRLGRRLAGEGGWTAASGYEYLRMNALSRLYLDNFANIQASWPTQGVGIAQLALWGGCNDAGSLMMEENVVAAAGTVYRLRLEELRGLIGQAGFEPLQRDYYYRPVGREGAAGV